MLVAVSIELIHLLAQELRIALKVITNTIRLRFVVCTARNEHAISDVMTFPETHRIHTKVRGRGARNLVELSRCMRLREHNVPVETTSFYVTWVMILN